MWNKRNLFEITIWLIVNMVKLVNLQDDNMENTIKTTPSKEVDQMKMKTNEQLPVADTQKNMEYNDCGWKPECTSMAKSLSLNNNRKDIEFFKKCISEVYCYKKASSGDKWISLPNYEAQFTSYFTDAAKRVERFFVRNNDWNMLLELKTLRQEGSCPHLLHIIAARYHYVVYVLNILFSDRKFGPCKYDPVSKTLENPTEHECFVVPLHPITCTSDFDIALMGTRSGSLAARFNQFFLEPLGADKFVPGFGKSSEEVFGANIFAFTLEYALPDVVRNMPPPQTQTLTKLRDKNNFKLEEIVTAIRKMRNYLPKYYNDLVMDQAELRSRETKDNLDKIFNDNVKLFNTIEEKVAGISSTQNSDISFRYEQDMARSMIQGVVENTGRTDVVANSMVEHSMATIYGAEVYHTTGTVRHVFGRKMGKPTLVTIVDVWASMLENWADSVKEFKRECEKRGLLVAQCLPKMSKYLARTLASMKRIRKLLPDRVEGNSFKDDLATLDDTAKIVWGWYVRAKRMGLDELPKSEIDNFKAFRGIFGCPLSVRFYSGDMRFHNCLDQIQNEIRKYNRRLFTYMAYQNKV
ncbi:uncharacterized protein LOC114523163 [Dendronephthya gigantea]|uniref:uncharacterized protein LOC114523163 n=1 Tax=Dendronephthya gigantea TaxID=151771 RepID=UPI00106C2C81|nr:uncharacterized protein LOC114523163 [Dendronephthya gigantea]XP_028399826.1 uncharacterized protein LOC114523163 [Dendronephthya gigantea]